MKLPHWAQLALAFAVVTLAWVMNNIKSGELILPATAVSVLSALQLLVGLFSQEVNAGTLADKRGFSPVRVLFALAGAGIVFAAVTMVLTACPPGSSVPPTVIDLGACITDVVSKDKLAGMTWEQAFEDAAIKCLGSASPENIAVARKKWIDSAAAVDRVRAADGGTP